MKIAETRGDAAAMLGWVVALADARGIVRSALARIATVHDVDRVRRRDCCDPDSRFICTAEDESERDGLEELPARLRDVEPESFQPDFQTERLRLVREPGVDYPDV